MTNTPRVPNHDNISLDAQLNDAVDHHRAGRLIEAEEIYRRILAVEPDYPHALCLLGTIAQATGQYDQAIELISRAITVKPDYADAYCNLGIVLQTVGRNEEALASFDNALALSPNHPEAHSNKGVALKETGRLDDAIASHRKAIALDPDYARAHFNLGNALKETGRPEDAVASYRRAIEIKPDYASAHNNLGRILQEQGRLDEATESCRKALAFNRDHSEALCTLGSLLEEQDRLEEGEAACRRAIELKPDYPQAHTNLALILFRKGHLKEAWDEYEWRCHLPEHALSARAYPQPPWDGSPLEGKNILLWTEQGIGDEIRYAGMIPDVLETGASVSIVCDERVVDLFARSFDGARVFAAPFAEPDAGADVFDFQCPFGSLGKFLRPDQDSFPADRIGYLKADPELMKFWKQRLSDISDRPKVGLAWSSASKVPIRVLQYANIEELAPILTLDGIDFINLQSHESHEDINEAKERYGVDIHSWDDLDLRNDLNDVAALTSGLDLVISFPTFSSEFAGALGVPTLCFAFHKEIIDQLGTEDAIWHPQIHYVCKNRTDPWQGVLKEIAKIAKKKLGQQESNQTPEGPLA